MPLANVFHSPLDNIPEIESDIHLSNWLEMNRQKVRTKQEDTAYVDVASGTAYTFTELQHQSDILSRALNTLSGIDPKSGSDVIQSIGILSPNHSLYPVIIHACVRAGITYAPLSGYAKATEIASDTRGDSESPKFVVFGESEDATQKGSRNSDIAFEKVLEMGSREVYFSPRLPPRGVMYIGFSSGTTGPPKGVMITHKNFISSMTQINSAAPAPNSSSEIPPILNALTVLPMYHAIGMIYVCFRPFMSRTVAHFARRFSLKPWFESIEKYKISSLTCVPSMLQAMVSDEGKQLAKQYDISSVINVSAGGSYLPPATKQAMRELINSRNPNSAVNIVGAYGMSEAVIAITAIVPNAPWGEPNPPNSSCAPVGVLQPGMSGRLIDPETLQDVQPGEFGELIVRGPNVSPGYINNPEANRSGFFDGWLRTGDKFSVDKKGELYFIGRTKETFKCRGLQVSPSELSSELIKLSYVEDVAVAGIQSDDVFVGEEAWAWIVKKGNLSDQEVCKNAKEALQKNLARHKWLAAVRIVESIPKTGTSKVDVKPLAQSALEEKKAKTNKAKL